MKQHVLILCIIAVGLFLTTSCNDWEGHYDKTFAENIAVPDTLPDLMTLIEDEANYSYISTLLKAETFDKEIAENPNFTLLSFTDAQFDNTVKEISPKLFEVLQSDSAFNMEVVKATLLRNMFVGKNKIAAGKQYTAFDGKKVTVNFSTEALQQANHINVYPYSNTIHLFPTDFFTVKIEMEQWDDMAIGWGVRTKEVLIVPKAFNGNGSAKWFSGKNSHFYIKIGGMADGKSYNVIDGVDYKINLCLGLYRVIKAAFWTYDENLKDKKLFCEESEYYDADNDFMNADLNKGMQLLQLETPLYNKRGKSKFHIDFRKRDFPLVNEAPPTEEQKGIIIDYIELIPQFK